MSQEMFRGLMVEEIVEILYPAFEAKTCEDQDHVDVECPLDVVTLMDAEKGPDSINGTAEIQNVPETHEIHCASTKAFEIILNVTVPLHAKCHASRHNKYYIFFIARFDFP
jgi:hypothetical protein